MPLPDQSWVIYLEERDLSGARWFSPFVEYGETPEEAVDQLLLRRGRYYDEGISHTPVRATVYAGPPAAEFKLEPIVTAKHRRADAAS